MKEVIVEDTLLSLNVNLIFFPKKGDNSDDKETLKLKN